MDDDQQFCLRWNNHQSTLISVFDTLLENETLVDCTLAAEGKFLKAHKVVLSACSPYFATLLQEQYDKHPIFILKDVKYQELRAMMDYMYRGEVNISQDQLAALLKAAESLQIKGLSDNRSGGSSGTAAAAAAAQAAPKPDSHHRVKLSGTYTLEQTKRARIATGGGSVPMDAGDVSGSREGSSSPSRRRRKVRRRSMENDMHDNSNSSVLQAASNQSILQQTSASLTASALVSTQLASGSSAANAAVAAATNAACGSSNSSSQVSNQPLTSSSSNVTKKTESAKLTSTAAQGAQQQQQQQQTTTTSDAINTDNVQQQQQQQQNQDAQGDADEMDVASGAGVASGTVAVHTGVVKQLTTLDKSNHKQKIKDNSITTELVIEPKAEYDEDAHDENVEDLTLDEEDMTMEELDQAAGTSQGGEGSSQAYATWQHDRSQDELGLMAAQDAQQRDPQDSNFDFAHSVFGGDSKNDRDDPHERFPCAVCGKSYLRKRHLQRHMRDECIGIPPRFNCEFCSSRFRRKYHMVRHLVSKHGIPPTIAQQTTGSGSRTSSPRELKLEAMGTGLVGGGSIGGGGVGHSDSASVGSAGSHNGCESPIPENLSLRNKDHYERDENLNGSRCTSPLPPHMMPIPTYGLTGAITAISAAAAVVEEQAAAAAAAAAAIAAAGNNNGGDLGGANGVAELAAAAAVAAELGIKPEPVTPGKTNPHHLLDEEWNMKMGLQIISNSLLKERLMNTMPFAYNNN